MSDDEKEMMEMAQRNMMMSKMYLLFEEKGELPASEAIHKKLNERGYKTSAERVSNEGNMRLFYLPDYTVDFSDKKGVPYQLIMLNYAEAAEAHGDGLDRTQFWNTPDGAELIDSCRWQVVIGEFMSSTHPPEVRARILSDWLSVALDLFPLCKAVWFEGSRNVMTAESLMGNPYEGADRIFHGAVNARYFRVGDTDEMVVDTLGLHVFGMPDVQFHFHGLDPNNVVTAAYDVAMYQFNNGLPIKDGETIDGFDADGEYKEDIRWKCQYEMALVAPKREVLDVNAGEHAAGSRK
ncbi:MAG: DUF4261 domain-containing protein [Methanomassiliicoccaceae archaeon]|nr:DUF4261 domain-containing protein [Methanomassiliicoccaceae archaeon]